MGRVQLQWAAQGARRDDFSSERLIVRVHDLAD